jgi:hypothetical protein
MTNEEKNKIRAIIREHRKLLDEFTKHQGNEIDELQEMIDSNVRFSSVRNLPLFPCNARQFGKEAIKELVEKYCADFNEKLFRDSEKTSDVHERTAKEMLDERGYDTSSIMLFENESYDSALIGVTDDDRAVYSYDKMVEWYVNKNSCSVEEAMEWIDYNTLRAIPYAGAKAPIVIKELE